MILITYSGRSYLPFFVDFLNFFDNRVINKGDLLIVDSKNSKRLFNKRLQFSIQFRDTRRKNFHLESTLSSLVLNMSDCKVRIRKI